MDLECYLMFEICLRVFDFPSFLEPVLTGLLRSGLDELLATTVLVMMPLNRHRLLSSIIFPSEWYLLVLKLSSMLRRLDS